MLRELSPARAMALAEAGRSRQAVARLPLERAPEAHERPRRGEPEGRAASTPAGR